jgi:hypothetical protein
MQCKHHPDRESEHSCASCGIPLCGDCAEEGKPGNYYCFQCAMVQSVSQVGTSLKDKREKSAKKKEKEQKKWGSFQYFLVVSGVLIVSMWGYIFFGGQEVPASRIDYKNQPRILLFMVDGAIKRFANYEGKIYPEKLTDLIPKYLDIVKVDLAHLNSLSYQRDARVGYRLTLKNPKERRMDISITPQGIQYGSSSGEGG